MLLSIPKQSGNQYTSAFSADSEKAKSKAETIKEMGYERHAASDYQRKAESHQEPEVILLQKVEEQVRKEAEARRRATQNNDTAKAVASNLTEQKSVGETAEIMARKLGVSKNTYKDGKKLKKG